VNAQWQAIIRAGVGTIAACLLVVASGCGSGGKDLGTPTGPSVVQPTPQPSLPPPQGQGGLQISVGEEFTDTLTNHGTSRLYQLTAPSNGTLIVRLSWDAHRGSLELKLADRSFACLPPDWSPPIVGELPVAAGQTYSVKISDGVPWDYDDLYLPYVVTTSMK
jgi:hypothetical protein